MGAQIPDRTGHEARQGGAVTKLDDLADAIQAAIRAAMHADVHGGSTLEESRALWRVAGDLAREADAEREKEETKP